MFTIQRENIVVILEKRRYLAEDLHTCYWSRFGGGHKRGKTFIEYCKDLIDQLNAYHSKQNSLKVNSFTQSTNSIHFYDSIVVIEKNIRNKPISETTGELSFPIVSEKKTLLSRIINFPLKSLNACLYLLRLPAILKK